MTDYEIDFQILHTIKKGHHKFTEIFDIVKGSKLKFSTRLKSLVEDGIIKKTTVEDRPHFDLADIESYEDMQALIKGVKRRTSNIEKDSKNFSDKKLVKVSAETTILYLTHFSLLFFHMLFAKPKSPIQVAEQALAKTLLRYIDKIRETVLKRDPDLLPLYYDLVKKFTLEIEKLYNK